MGIIVVVVVRCWTTITLMYCTGTASQEAADSVSGFSLSLCGSASAVRVEQQQKRRSSENFSAVGSVRATTSSSSSHSPPPRKSLTDRFSQSFSLPADSHASPERSQNGKSKSFDSSSFSPQIQSMIRKNNSVSPMSSPSDDKSRRLSMAITSAST